MAATWRWQGRVQQAWGGQAVGFAHLFTWKHSLSTYNVAGPMLGMGRGACNGEQTQICSLPSAHSPEEEQDSEETMASL